jgi:hypothetical protein
MNVNDASDAQLDRCIFWLETVAKGKEDFPLLGCNMGKRKINDKLYDAGYVEFSLSSGICDNFPRIDVNLFSELFKTWDRFSGNIQYPVPHPGHLKDPPEDVHELAYFHYDNKWVGAYGLLRFELIDHLIKELKILKNS